MHQARTGGGGAMPRSYHRAALFANASGDAAAAPPALALALERTLGGGSARSERETLARSDATSHGGSPTHRSAGGSASTRDRGIATLRRTTVASDLSFGASVASPPGPPQASVPAIPSRSRPALAFKDRTANVQRLSARSNVPATQSAALGTSDPTAAVEQQRATIEHARAKTGAERPTRHALARMMRGLAALRDTKRSGDRVAACAPRSGDASKLDASDARPEALARATVPASQPPVPTFAGRFAPTVASSPSPSAANHRSPSLSASPQRSARRALPFLRPKHRGQLLLFAGRGQKRSRRRPYRQRDRQLPSRCCGQASHARLRGRLPACRGPRPHPRRPPRSPLRSGSRGLFPPPSPHRSARRSARPSSRDREHRVWQPLCRRASRPVRRPVRPVRRPARPIRRPSRPVRRPARSMGQPLRPVRRRGHPMRQPARPIRQPSRPVRRPARSMRRASRPVRRPARSIRQPARPFRRAS